MMAALLLNKKEEGKTVLVKHKICFLNERVEVFIGISHVQPQTTPVL